MELCQSISIEDRMSGLFATEPFFEVAITEGVAQIPPHAEKDDLGLVVTPLEEIGFGHRQTSEKDSGSEQSTIIDTRHPFFATQPTNEMGRMFIQRTEGSV